MQQMNQVLQMVNSSTVPALSAKDAQAVAHHQKEQPKRRIGFQTQSKEQMIQALYRNGDITEGEKLAPKSEVVNIKKRQENQKITDFYKELEQLGVVEHRRGRGYYAVADYQTAINSIK
jgi:DNA-binding transcriptional regulator YhcF (GntR family)